MGVLHTFFVYNFSFLLCVFYTAIILKLIFMFSWLLYVNTWKFILKQLVASGSVITSLYIHLAFGLMNIGL